MRLSPRSVLAAHLVGLAALLAPVALNRLPPLVDFPQTVAKMYVPYAAGHDVHLAQNYEVSWGYVPYIATDLLFPPLFLLFEPYDAGRVYLAVTLVLTAIAPAILHRTLFGGLSPWPLLAYLVAYHHMVFWGFLNYILAVPLILLGFTAWIATESWGPARRAAVFSVVAFILMSFHLFAWGAFGLLLAGTQLPKLRAGQLVPVAWSVVPFAASFAAWRLLPPPRPGHTVFVDDGERFRYGDFAERVRDLAAPFNFDFLATDVLLLVAAGCFLYWLVRERTVRVHEEVRWPLAVLGVAVFAMPHIILGGWGTMRLPVLFTLIFVAATEPKAPSRTLVAVAAVAVALFTVRMGQIQVEWNRCQGPLGEVRSALMTLERGASVLAVLAEGESECLRRPVLSHVVAYAVADRSAYSPELRGFSTVFPAAKHDALARVGGPLDPGQLDAETVATIRREADYLLYMHLGAEVRLPDEGFTPTQVGSYFTLFRTDP